MKSIHLILKQLTITAGLLVSLLLTACAGQFQFNDERGAAMSSAQLETEALKSAASEETAASTEELTDEQVLARFITGAERLKAFIQSDALPENLREHRETMLADVETMIDKATNDAEFRARIVKNFRQFIASRDNASVPTAPPPRPGDEGFVAPAGFCERLLADSQRTEIPEETRLRLKADYDKACQ